MMRTTANRTGGNRTRHRRGQALVPVIFVMLILTVVGVAFSVAAHRSAQASGNFVAQTQRFYAARGAVNYAMSALAQTSGNGSTYGIVPPLPDTDANGWAQLGDAWVKIETIDTGACINLNTVTQATLQKIPVFQDNPDLAAAVIQWRTPQTGQAGAASDTTTGGTASSAASNSASSGTDPYQSLSPPYTIKGANYDSVEELLLVQGMTPTLLYGTPAGTPIVAQDAENAKASGTTTNGTTGASSTSGTSGKVGSASRAAGVTRQAAQRPTTPATAGTPGSTGTPATAGTPGTTGTPATSAAMAEDFTDTYTDSTTALTQMFTTTSRERNLATDGTLRLNVNTATAQDMQTQLGLTTAQAQSVIRFRTGGQNGGQTGGQNGGPAATPARPTLPNAPAPAAPAAPRTPARSIEAYGQRSRQAGMAAPTAPAAAGGTGARTPTGGAGPTGGSGGTAAQTTTFKTIADLLETTAFTRTVMQRVADRVSVDDKAFRENVININTAPAEVLATVPGMTHTILNAILTYRQGGQTFQDLGDLFSLQDLQRTDFQAIIASLTTRTTTYYVHIKVRTAAQQGIYAVSALVELGDNGPHILQWRETERAPGWSTWITPPTLATPTPGQNLSGMTNAPAK